MSRRYAEDFPDLVFDDKFAICSEQVLRDLPEYSCSMPTGRDPGKVWKRQVRYGDKNSGWVLGYIVGYEKDGKPYIRWDHIPLEIVTT